MRKETDLPKACFEWGWKYHHMGIPTDKPIENERYIPHLKMYVSGFETSAYGIEWMRFEKGCEVHELIQKIAHIAFEVENLEKALEGKEILSGISSPMEGIKVAMIVENGVPIELMEFNTKSNIK